MALVVFQEPVDEPRVTEVGIYPPGFGRRCLGQLLVEMDGLVELLSEEFLLFVDEWMEQG